MILYVLVLEEWVMDENHFFQDASSIEIYDTKEARDARLKVLNGGRSQEWFVSHREDHFSALEIELNKMQI